MRLSGADVDATLEGSVKSRMGLVFGGFVTFEISDAFAIQPELLYTMKGGKASEGGEDLVVKLDYLEIPVLAKFNIPTEGSVKPCLFAGPAVALKLSAKYKWTGDGESETGDVSEIGIDVKGLDLGLVFGAGLKAGMGETGGIIVDIRYTLGLQKAAKAGDVDVKIKNGGFSLMVGYSF